MNREPMRRSRWRRTQRRGGRRAPAARRAAPRPRRLRRRLRRDAPLHRGAHRGDTPTRSGCSSIRRSTRWARPARHEHLLRATAIPVRADRPRRPDHLSRPGPGRRLPAARPAPPRAHREASGLAARAGGDRAARGARTWQARGAPGAPGVYVGGAKIAALGLRVRGGCSYHGLALNVDMDLAPFARHQPLRLRGSGGHPARRPGRRGSTARRGRRAWRRLAAAVRSRGIIGAPS